jgi:hypothetical protein
LEVLKKIRKPKNINQIGHTIKMMSPVLTLQAEIIEILLSQENVVRCLQSTYGIPTQCNQSLISILEQVPKVLVLYLSVHVDQSNDHTMYIYNVQRKKMLLSLSAGSDAIANIQWSKKPNDLKFCAVTSRSLQFWNPADASKKLYKNGTFGSKFT